MKRKINKIISRNHNKPLLLYYPKEQLGVIFYIILLN